jgi:CHAD domain-containing protein
MCMKQFEVKKQVKDYSKKLQSSYTNVLEDFEQEEIHDFRLYIKKLNAFLWLLNGEKPHDDLKIKKPIQQFYHTLGTIRNLQLHNGRVKDLCHQHKLPLPLYYLQSLEQKESEEKKAAREQALQLNTRKLLRKLSDASPQRIENSMIENFIITNIAALTKLLTQPMLQEKNLHEARKILKRFLYVWPWIKTNLHKEEQALSLSNDLCDTLSEKLGNFMDSCFALRFFEAPYSMDSANAEEITVLHSLQAHLAANKQCQYEDAVAALKNLSPENEVDCVALSPSLKALI